MNKERRYAIQSKHDSEAERLAYMIENMSANKAYRYAVKRAGGDPDRRLLEKFRERFRWYRTAWRGNPKYAIEHKLHHESFRDAGYPPLCVDIETSATCDLACQFCYRQWIATPDRIMRENLYYRIIDQCAEIGVPSIKLNWRGEPLLHPKLPKFIDYAKSSGILETIINTNAVTLTEEKSKALIEAGLDLLIYSFDGGSKETYEQMRVGRFKKIHFERVYNNIRRFADIREEMGSIFPRTKIQMILTEETFKEKDTFFTLFSDCVDDVSVKAYTERHGQLSGPKMDTNKTIKESLHQKEIPRLSEYWQDLHGNHYYSSGRLPCEQPFQRLVVTYDGRVGMCCYDWGIEYPIGYVDVGAFEEGDRQFEIVIDKARTGARGFELLSDIKMPKRYVEPPKRIQTLQEIWNGDLINDVRQKHTEGRLNQVPVCELCPFKETYHWVKLELQNESEAC